MKSWLVPLLAGGALLVQAPVASATTFSWSYSGLHGYTVSASGTLDATPLGGGAYQVTSITGQRNGVAVTGPTNYAVEDNQVFDTFPSLDFFGLAFFAGPDAFNIYYDTDTLPSYGCGFIGYCEIGPGVSGTDGLGPPIDPIHSIKVSIAAVPEPSAWALMLVGIGGLGAALRRRQRPGTAIA